MRKVSTAQILAEKSLGTTSVSACVEWAVGMLEEGYVGDNLQQLAGQLPPFNYFEIVALRERTLIEQNVAELDKSDAVIAYACELACRLLDDDMRIHEDLAPLHRLCIENDYDDRLMPFYLLYYAWEDLQSSDVQWYWDGATKRNINRIIRKVAQDFLDETRGKLPTSNIDSGGDRENR
jgi:hypothetical protein